MTITYDALDPTVQCPYIRSPPELDMGPLATVHPRFKLVHLRTHPFPPTGTRIWSQVGGRSDFLVVSEVSCRSEE